MGECRIVRLIRYPIKGFEGEPLEDVAIRPDETFPFDRAYAIENGDSGFDPAAPKHFPKIAFLMRMKNADLARLAIRFDERSRRLEISENGTTVASGELTSASGRSEIETFIAARFADDLRGTPRILHAEGHSFSDVPEKRIHLVNLETVRAAGKIVGRDLDPARFRANVYIDGLPAWTEFNWLDKEITSAGLRFTVTSRTKRCAAVDVDPETAERDTQIPQALMEALGHRDLGIYLRAESEGHLKVGQSIAQA
ncbi:MOSC domain-containing protein [Rhizobiales bacterium]|uniref:MOSC domain-containing protein n=1 Tax=Hongsoonwoonella zoysiae TaxID=2821844 RepID=UPI001560442B|nr:MOSC domain-containing protein [Hongsoonwoonella zoysiae]NRG17193.1 MOSC domain-containing protein [Hongsoonwoonella zoysiae]